MATNNPNFTPTEGGKFTNIRYAHIEISSADPQTSYSRGTITKNKCIAASEPEGATTGAQTTLSSNGIPSITHGTNQAPDQKTT